MSKILFIRGLIKHLFNPRISLIAFVSSDSYVDKTAFVYRGVKMKGSAIGAHSYIAAYTDVENAEIGKYCSIADHCRVGLSGHTLNYLSTSPLFTQVDNALHERWIEKDIVVQKIEQERVFIGNDVWIGSHALIRGGVHVGDGACIAAGAVVVKDVEPYSIVGGVPAKTIRYRFHSDLIKKIEQVKWWDLPDEVLKRRISLFQSDNVVLDNLVD